MATGVGLSWRGLMSQVEAIIKLSTKERYRSTASSVKNEQPYKTDGQDVDLSEGHKLKMMQLLQAYQSNLADFDQFVRFSSSGYTKNLVADIKLDNEAKSNDEDKPVAANVIIMCWAPKQASAVHAHEGSRCFVKVLQGQLTERRLAHPKFLKTDSKPELPLANSTSKSVMSLNDVCYIDDQIGCHQVTNESLDEPAVTLHVYVPAYKKCRVFHVAQTASVECFSLTIAESETIDVFQ
jgi:cysteine dioxygenase